MYFRKCWSGIWELRMPRAFSPDSQFHPNGFGVSWANNSERDELHAAQWPASEWIGLRFLIDVLKSPRDNANGCNLLDSSGCLQPAPRLNPRFVFCAVGPALHTLFHGRQPPAFFNSLSSSRRNGLACFGLV